MPSRKKAKGKARKAAKEAKAKEEGSRAVEVAANQRQEESVETQMQRMIISAASPKICAHGWPSLSADEEKIFEDFINAYLAAFHSQDKVGQGFVTAYNATEEKYGKMYSSKLGTVISMFLSYGAQCILGGDKNNAQLYASFASYFEDYMAIKSKAMPNVSQTFELLGADDHTLVSFYRKRIPCSCLDETYKKVKSVKKMGRCDNPGCRLPGRQAERSKMFYCTRCEEANYCSAECQRAHWKRHKKLCDIAVKLKDSEQS